MPISLAEIDDPLAQPTERVVRRTSKTPALRSSSLMRMLADALDRPSRRAVSVKLRVAASTVSR